MPFKELIEKTKELNKQIDEICQTHQIRQIHQRVEDLSEKRKELCRRSFMIQSEEIKNDIIELRNNLVSQKRKIKNKQKSIEKEINKLETDLNDLVLSDSKLYKKSYLENLYFFSAIIIGSIPIMSSIGLMLLYSYLKEINATIDFLEAASTGGIWFSFVAAATILILFWLMPIFIFTFKLQKVNNDTEPNLDIKIIIPLLYFLSFLLSLVGFYLFSSNQLFSLCFSLIWNALIFFIVHLTNRININFYFGAVLIFWLIIMSLALHTTSVFSINFSLANLFKITEFNQQNYSWFKVNNTYFERTGLDIGNLKAREGDFSSRHNINIIRNNNDVLLYGKLWVNSTKIKILCPPDSFTKEGYPVDIKAENVGKICLPFQEGDLQNLTGLVSAYPLKK